MSSFSSPLVPSSCDNKNNQKNIFRARSSSYEGPLLPNNTSHSTAASTSAEERRDYHYRSESKDSCISMMMMMTMNNHYCDSDDDDDDDIILEQKSTPTLILPADNQLLSAWSYFASRFSSKSEFQQDY